MEAINLSDEKDKIKQALAFIHSGAYSEAEAIYRKLICAGSSDPRVFSNLGALCGMDGRASDRLEWLQKAICLDSDYSHAHLNLGVAHQEDGRLEDAIMCYKEALRLDPDLPEAHCNLGLAFYLCGDLEAAIASLNLAIKLKADYAEALGNLGQLKVSIGDDSAALELYGKCVKIAPRNVSYRFAFGCVLSRLKLVAEALAEFEYCMLADPGNLDTLLELCACLGKLGRSDEVVLRIFPAVADYPNDARVLISLARAVRDIDYFDQSIQILEQALLVDQNNYDCLNLLGVYLQDIGRIDDAIIHYERARLVQPDSVDATCNLAIAYRFQGRYNEALSLFLEVVEANPKRRDVYHGLLFHYSIGSEQFVPASLQAASFYWNLVGEQIPSSANTSFAELLYKENKLSRRRIRIGILCSDLGEHVVSLFLRPLLEHYNRDVFEIDVISTRRMYHDYAKHLSAMATSAYSLQGIDTVEARHMIKKKEYDLILETSGFTRLSGIEILAERCAPVQAHYIGYHATTGLDTMDYFIGDEETVPEEFAPHFSEKLWRLPRTWLSYSPAEEFPPAVTEVSKDVPVLGSFNQLSKIREETLRFWTAALLKLPASLLILKDRCAASESVQMRIKSFLHRQGVSADRVFFLNHSPNLRSHLLHYNMIDVALDATPWSSATTAFDAIGMGVPIVAIRGNSTSARMSSSVLLGLGKSEWIASTPVSYSEIVAKLCQDLVALRNGRAERQKHAWGSTLFDNTHMCRELEKAFIGMVNL